VLDTLKADFGSLQEFTHMGAQTIPQHFVIQWDNDLRFQASQKESRLMGTVTSRGTITGESFTINRLSDTGMLDQKTQRFAQTQLSERDHSTVIVTMQDFYRAEGVDRSDEAKLIANPISGGGGAYMQGLIQMRNRRVDDIIFQAALATVTMKDGSSIALPAGQKIVAGGTGFTKAKLIQMRGLFRKNEADAHTGEDLYLPYNYRMATDILSDTTLTNADFMATKFLQEGDIVGKWMGFTWIPYESILFDGTTYTTAAWAKSGIHLGDGYVEGTAQRRPDMQNLMQVDMAASYGAGRQDEVKVVQTSFV